MAAVDPTSACASCEFGTVMTGVTAIDSECIRVVIRFITVASAPVMCVVCVVCVVFVQKLLERGQWSEGVQLPERS